MHLVKFYVAAQLSSSPSYGEVLALKHNFDLEDEDIDAMGIILPSMVKDKRTKRILILKRVLRKCV